MELKKDWPSKFYQYGFAIIAFQFLTGLYLLFVKRFNFFDQFILLSHLSFGFFLIISLYFFIQRFIIYRRFWNDKIFHLLGLSTIIAFASSLTTGIIIFFLGISGLKWIWFFHISVSFLFSFLILTYIFLVLVRAMIPLKGRPRAAFEKMIRSIAARVSVIVVIIISFNIISSRLYHAPDPYFKVGHYEMPFENNNPFFPSMMSTTNNTFYKKDNFANSKSCGTSGCHTGVYKQWEESAHLMTPNYAVSAVQKALATEGKRGNFFDKVKSEHIKKINTNFPGREAFRTCAACHAPVALISGHVNSGRPLETFTEFEGVSCTLCHSIEKSDIRGGGDYSVTAPEQYLFSNSKNKIGQFIHHTLIRTRPEYHKITYNKPFYKETKYCVSCHERLHFKSWDSSQYHDKKNANKTKHCQHCHMPQVTVKDEISAKEKGTIADHRFLSGGLTIAKYYGKEEQYKKTVDFLQNKKISSKIIAPKNAKPGSVFKFVVRNASLEVGHNFPAGPEADLVEAWVEIKAISNKGKILFAKGELDKDNHLDTNENFIYHSVPYDSFGNKLPLTRHHSWRYVEDRHQVIAPRMFHDIPFEFKIPLSLKGSFTISSYFQFRRPNQHFADWALGKGVFKVPHISMDNDLIVVELNSNDEKLEIAKKEYEKELSLEVISENIKKMHSFPAPERQIDMETKVTLDYAYSLLKKGDVLKAIEEADRVGPLAKKTRPYRHFLKRANYYKSKRMNEKLKDTAPHSALGVKNQIRVLYKGR